MLLSKWLHRSPHRGRLLAIIALLACRLISAEFHPEPSTLPVFSPVPFNEEKATDLARRLYNISGFNITRSDTRIISISDTHRFEVDTANGGIWTTDESRMWNATVRPQLPDDLAARNISDNLSKQQGLLPQFESLEMFELNFDPMGGMYLAVTSAGLR